MSAHVASDAPQPVRKRGRPKGYRCSPEVRARMSAARKAAWADPEVRARMSAASKAALADPEVRARMSAARKAAWADPEVRAKVCLPLLPAVETMLRAHWTDWSLANLEARTGYSERTLRRWADELGLGPKPRSNAAHRAARADPEVRARMSAARKAALTPEIEAILRERWADWSMASLEARSGYSERTLRRWADELGLGPKPRSNAAHRSAIASGALDSEITELRAAGYSVDEILRRLGVGRDRLYARLRAMGAPLRPRFGRHPEPSA